VLIFVGLSKKHNFNFFADFSIPSRRGILNASECDDVSALVRAHAFDLAGVKFDYSDGMAHVSTACVLCPSKIHPVDGHLVCA